MQKTSPDLSDNAWKIVGVTGFGHALFLCTSGFPATSFSCLLTDSSPVKLVFGILNEHEPATGCHKQSNESDRSFRFEVHAALTPAACQVCAGVRKSKESVLVCPRSTDLIESLES